MPYNKEQNNINCINAEYYYKSVEIITDIAEQNKAKYEQFKERISKFATIDTIEEARELSKKIVPVSQEVNKFKVGSGTCTIINRKDLFRITLDSDTDFISYNFT